VSGENIYALVDVDWNRAETAFNAFPKAKRYRDFREMLAKDAANIDAVTVSTPDHTHAVAAMAALKAGKHVYCQKPLARTIGEVRSLMDEARRRPRQATQMGNQGHAGAGTRLIRELYEAGTLGTVREIHYWTNRPIWPQGIDRPQQAYNVPPHLDWNLWLGPAPDRPYAPDYAPFRWRGWWDFGTGALGDIAAHSMDAAYWTLDLGFPSRIEAETTRVFAETAPRVSRITYDFPARGNRQALRVVWRDGELGAPRPAGLPSGDSWPMYADPGSQVWIGSNASLIADVYGDRVQVLDPKIQADISRNPPAQKYPRVKNVYDEWITAAKAGSQPGSSFAAHAGPLTEMLLLGNLAVRLGQPVELDVQSGAVRSPTVPADYIRPAYRSGWSL
jgi:predicted dehydrogenase